MDTNPSTNRFISTFVVMKAVFDHLAPTDVSALVHATRFYNMMSESMRDQYMNIEREVSMCQPWTNSVIDHGHLVAIVGRDIYQMTKMFKDPFSYWSKGNWRQRATHEVWLVAQNKYMMRGTENYPKGDFMLISRDGNVLFKPRSWVYNKCSHPASTLVCNDDWCGQSWTIPSCMLFNPDNWPLCINHPSRREKPRQRRPAVLSDKYGGSTKFIYCESYQGIFGGCVVEDRLVHSDSEKNERSIPYVNMYEGTIRLVEVHELSEWKRMHAHLLFTTGVIYIHPWVVVASPDAMGKVLVLKLKGIGDMFLQSLVLDQCRAE